MHQEIYRTLVEKVNSCRYLGVHISEDQTWLAHITSQVKKAMQHLYHLRHLKTFKISSGLQKPSLQLSSLSSLEASLPGMATATPRIGNLSIEWSNVLSASQERHRPAFRTFRPGGAGPERLGLWKTFTSTAMNFCLLLFPHQKQENPCENWGNNVIQRYPSTDGGTAVQLFNSPHC